MDDEDTPEPVIRNHLTLAVVSVLGFAPFGFAAVYQAVMAQRSARFGQHQAAKRAAGKAHTLALQSLFIGTAVVVIMFLFIVFRK